MKSKINFFFTCLLAVLFTAIGLVSCKDEGTFPVVIRVEEPVSAQTTLLDYMQGLQEEGELTFSVENGLVTTLNGRKNAGNSYWMLYTSDSANANEQWGVYEHEGQQLGSALFGAETLIIAQGEVYVWVYQSF